MKNRIITILAELKNENIDEQCVCEFSKYEFFKYGSFPLVFRKTILDLLRHEVYFANKIKNFRASNICRYLKCLRK